MNNYGNYRKMTKQIKKHEERLKNKSRTWEILNNMKIVVLNVVFIFWLPFGFKELYLTKDKGYLQLRFRTTPNGITLPRGSMRSSRLSLVVRVAALAACC